MGGSNCSEVPSGDKICLGEGVQVQEKDKLQALLALTGRKDAKGFSGEEGEKHLCEKLYSLFSSPEELRSVFAQGTSASHEDADSKPNALGINFGAVRTLYQNIRAMDCAVVTEAIVSGSTKLLEERRRRRRFGQEAKDSEQSDVERAYMSSCLIILSNPALLEPEYHSLLEHVAKGITFLARNERALVVSTLSSLGKADLEEMVATVQQSITVQLFEAGRVTETVQLCTRLLKTLYDANNRSGVLPISAFYNDAVSNKDLVDPQEQYFLHRRSHRLGSFSFLEYPFVLDLPTKWQLLQLDSRLEQGDQFQHAIVQGLLSLGGYIEPFNVMRVRRDHLIHDAITHVQRRREDLKKQLRVQFLGEDAVDEGGVRKEFFQLVVLELFDPKYGMFSASEDRQHCWFSLQPSELTQLQQERLVLEAIQRHAERLAREEEEDENKRRRKEEREGPAADTTTEVQGNGPRGDMSKIRIESGTSASRAAETHRFGGAPPLERPLPDMVSGLDNTEEAAAAKEKAGSASGELAEPEEGRGGPAGEGPSQGTEDEAELPTVIPAPASPSLNVQGDAQGDSRTQGENQDVGGRTTSDSRAELAQAEFEGASREDVELRSEYELVGMLLGLAIYNNCLLEVRFPSTAYKKLLGRRLTLADLESVDKDLAKGLRDLLNFDGDVEEVYDRTFQVTVADVFGDMHVVDLLPGGGSMKLTAQNRKKYVELCVKFYLEDSVQRQFEAFAKGFKHLVPEHMLRLLAPEELELLVCGVSELDFDDLEKGAHYTDGYTKGHKTIQQFWRVAHHLSEEEKKNLLMFVTGCDRAPIKGLASLKLTISRNGPDSDRLPSAHTCFNHLLLPEYASEEKLKDRLITAINNAKGFGLQ